jgi:hypothetical protein
MPSCLLPEYQTLIVGALGFAGVIATLFTNAWLSRKQHTRQVDQERTALKAALSAELSIIRDAFLDRIKMVAEAPETQSMLVPLDTMTEVYGRTVDKLGLFSRDQVNLVLRAYILIRQMPDRLRFFQGPEETPPAGYLRISSKHVGHVRQMHENFLVDINSAISALTV